MAAAKAILARLQNAGPGLAALAGLGALGYGVSESLYNVPGGHQAIMYSRLFPRGLVEGADGVAKTVGEGLHFRIPGLQRPIIYEIRTRQQEYRGQRTGTKDLQTVTLDLRVLYRPDDKKLGALYREVGASENDRGMLGYDNMILPSIVVEVLKGTVASFDADKLVTEREAVSKMIREQLEARGELYGVQIEDVAITDLNFSQVYARAVERKQISQQKAQRAQILVRKATQEKQQKIVEAQGETESARLLGEKINDNPAYLNLEKIKAAKEIATTIAQSTNRVYLNADSLLLDVNSAAIDANSLSKKTSSW